MRFDGVLKTSIMAKTLDARNQSRAQRNLLYQEQHVISQLPYLSAEKIF